MLKKCIADPVCILPLEGLKVDANLSYEEVLIKILQQQVKMFRNKNAASVKVLWKNKLMENATLEAEADMMSQYLHLFPSSSSQGWD